MEEDVILAWAAKADAGKLLGVPAEAGRAVRQAVAQVVEWLQQQSDEVGRAGLRTTYNKCSPLRIWAGPASGPAVHRVHACGSVSAGSFRVTRRTTTRRRTPEDCRRMAVCSLALP